MSSEKDIRAGEPDFKDDSKLLPAVIQHAVTREVLMLGYMNREAFLLTKSSGRVTFFSRSKDRLWEKGETSGHYLLVREIRIDCDCDTILIKAAPQGPTCHTGSDTCFGESCGEGTAFLSELAATIHARKVNRDSGSYTAELFASGVDRMAQKVGEEAVEVVIEAKNDSADRLKSEAADLLFHLMVLLESRDISLADIGEYLRGRARARASTSA